MTPERVRKLVAQWVRLYTRGLPTSVAQRRADEIDADIHDHIAHERARDMSDRQIALNVLSRMVRGIAADVSWRSESIARHPKSKEGKSMNRPAYRSAIRVAAVTAFVLLLPLVGMQFSEEVNWSLFDFVFAGALLGGTGILLELAARKTSNLGYLAVATAIGVGAIALGEADDAPGLVLFGCLLIAGAIALGFKTAQRST